MCAHFGGVHRAHVLHEQVVHSTLPCTHAHTHTQAYTYAACAHTHQCMHVDACAFTLKCTPTCSRGGHVNRSRE